MTKSNKMNITWRSFVPICYKEDANPVSPVPASKLPKGPASDPDPGSPMSAKDISDSVGSNLHAFTLQELRTITHGFSTSNFIGEGGFGPVHKGFVDDKTKPGLSPQPVAVKHLDLEGLQGHREWFTEVVLLGKLSHPNLVKLIGYCYEDEHRLLVYEYMPRGSLENHLFRKYGASLTWSVRMKIALEAAKGLAYLHGAQKQVIYRDFKASNILLDSDYTAKLSDFGLAKDGPEGDKTHVSTRVMGTHGYAAPEYVMTGHLTTMSDIYSYGVVFLELLTGRRSMDKTRPSREQNLVEWARPYLNEHRKLDRILDPRLEGQYPTSGAQKAAALAYQCLSHQPKSRPAMSSVVKTLEGLQNFNDMSVETFVYIAPVESCKEDVKPKEESKKGNGDRRHNESQQRRGHRHRVRSPSPTVYSSPSPNQSLNGGLNSPMDCQGAKAE